MAAGELGVAVGLQGDPAEGDVDPEVVAAAFQGKAEGVAGAFGVAGLPELHAVLVVAPPLEDAAGVDEFVVVALGQLAQADRPATPGGRPPTSVRVGAPSVTLIAGPSITSAIGCPVLTAVIS